MPPAADSQTTAVLKEVQNLTEQIRELVGTLNEPQQANTQTSVHNSNVGGFATGIAVASCVATLLLMIAFMVIENRSYAHLDNQVDQLRAWNDVHSKEIARLQAAQTKRE